MFTTFSSSAFFSALVAAAPKPSTGQENNPFLPKSLQDGNGVKPTNRPFFEKWKVGRQLLTPKAKEVEKYSPDNKALRNTIPKIPAVEVIPNDVFDPVNELGLLANVPSYPALGRGDEVFSGSESISRELSNCGCNPEIPSGGVFDFQNLIQQCYEDGIRTDACPYEPPIGCWDVSRVTSMYNAFYQQFNFNEDISLWNTGSVTNMKGMFGFAVSFNADISNWNVSKVTDMTYIFVAALPFDKNLKCWDVGNVTSMKSMFLLTSFNAPIDEWDVGKVIDMRYMFGGTPFNQCLSSWAFKVPGDVNTRYMFDTASFQGFDPSDCTDKTNPLPSISPWCQTSSDGCIFDANSTPSECPSATHSTIPCTVPTGSPSSLPSSAPSGTPSAVPSSTPSTSPSAGPSAAPSGLPSSAPSGTPSAVPSSTPSTSPSVGPSAAPSGLPSSTPSGTPSAVPSSTPSTLPSAGPSGSPSGLPSSAPSGTPSDPTESPTGSPTENSLCKNNPDQFTFTAELTCEKVASAGLKLRNDLCNNLQGNIKASCPNACELKPSEDNTDDFTFTSETTCDEILSTNVSMKTISILCDDPFGLALNCPQFCPATDNCPCVDSILPFKILGGGIISCAEVNSSEDKDKLCKRGKIKGKCLSVCATPGCD